MTSWMLARLKRETQALRAAADEGRLEILRTTATLTGYANYLSRIYGFEAPIESAFAATRDLGNVVDLRWRPQLRLLRSDLASLGIRDPMQLPATPMPPFASVAEALGWMYVVDQSAILHGQLHRHFARSLPEQLDTAGCYLLGVERVAGTRLADLGAVLDAHATRTEIASKIVDAACTAFRRQRLWFLKSLPLDISRNAAH